MLGALTRALRLGEAEAAHLRNLAAPPGGGRAGKPAAARLLTESGATADRLGMRALAREASELRTEC